MLALVVAMWIALTMPFAFVLLPVSRRRAKVRWGHLVRVGCYGLAIPSGVFAAMLLCLAVGYAAAELAETQQGDIVTGIVFFQVSHERLTGIRNVGQ